MDATHIAAVRKLERAAKALEECACVGADFYANGGNAARPVVAKHFTAGNQQRYGWPALSPAYAKAKRGQTASGALGAIRRGILAPLVGATGVRLEGGNLPMLVKTGATRAAVSQRKHQIVREGDTAWIIFDDLPEYAIYLHTGTDKMPKRSPVEPNELDAQEVRNAMQRYLDAQIGTGGDVPVSGSSIPGQARVG